MSKLTIDDLLNSLVNPEKVDLENTAATWKRIGSKDQFLELGLEPSELESFLKEWTESNPYSNI